MILRAIGIGLISTDEGTTLRGVPLTAQDTRLGRVFKSICLWPCQAHLPPCKDDARCSQEDKLGLPGTPPPGPPGMLGVREVSFHRTLCFISRATRCLSDQNNLLVHSKIPNSLDLFFC